jgi:hypothetical protein
MDLDFPKYQSGTEPEVLELEFTDWGSLERHGTAASGAWCGLAQEKAEALGIDMRIEFHEPGKLSVAFLQASDCNALLAAMQPEWKQRLMDTVKWYPLLNFRLVAEEGGDLEHHIEHFMQEFNFEREDVDNMLKQHDLL